MDLNQKHRRGWQIDFLIALKTRKFKDCYPIAMLSNVGYHKDQFFVLCFSYFILMVCQSVIYHPEYACMPQPTNLKYLIC